MSYQETNPLNIAQGGINRKNMYKNRYEGRSEEITMFNLTSAEINVENMAKMVDW